MRWVFFVFFCFSCQSYEQVCCTPWGDNRAKISVYVADQNKKVENEVCGIEVKTYILQVVFQPWIQAGRTGLEKRGEGEKQLDDPLADYFRYCPVSV